jgi:phosphopantothenoylcysteine decarboxylase/phosphopantothenate--cysteine ligase
MSEPERIFARTRQILIGRDDLRGKKVIISAGPTREPLDPVRYISNYSSGKMGYAIADAARGFGADVVLVSGPTSLEPPPGVNAVYIETASQMKSELEKHCHGADYLFMAAAVADFRPASYQQQKIKRTGQPMKLTLEPNPDIVKLLNKSRPKYAIGFALETENLEARAYDKLRNKKLDMIIANNPTEEGVEFGSDFNKVMIIPRDGKPVMLEKMSKFEVAIKIIEQSLTLKKRDVARK